MGLTSIAAAVLALTVCPPIGTVAVVKASVAAGRVAIRVFSMTAVAASDLENAIERQQKMAVKFKELSEVAASLACHVEGMHTKMEAVIRSLQVAEVDNAVIDDIIEVLERVRQESSNLGTCVQSIGEVLGRMREEITGDVV